MEKILLQYIYMNRLLSKIVNHQNYGFHEEPFLKGFK